MNAGLLRGIIGTAAVPILFLVFRKCFPIAPNCSADRPLDEMKADYWKYDLVAFPILLLFVPAVSYCTWLLVVALRDPPFIFSDDTYRLSCLHFAFAIPIVFTTAAASLPLTEVIMRYLLKERYEEYVTYQNQKNGFDGRRMSKFLVIGIGVGSIVLATLFSQWYFQFSPDEICFSPFLSLAESRLGYDEITAINSATAFEAPNGDTVQRTVYAIQFGDQGSWFSNLSPDSSSAEDHKPLVDTVARRSGLKVKELALMTLADQ